MADTYYFANLFSKSN